MGIKAKLLLLVVLMVGTASVGVQKPIKLTTTQPPTQPLHNLTTHALLCYLWLGASQYNGQIWAQAMSVMVSTTVPMPSTLVRLHLLLLGWIIIESGITG